MVYEVMRTVEKKWNKICMFLALFKIKHLHKITVMVGNGCVYELSLQYSSAKRNLKI